jgi:hypothetical protein
MPPARCSRAPVPPRLALVAVLVALLGACDTVADRESPAPRVQVSAAPSAPPSASSQTSRPSVAAAVGQLVDGLPGDGVSVAALNLTTGQSYHYGAETGMPTGSVVKLDILETLLLANQGPDHPLGDADQLLATAMIVNSDNDAATMLWEQLGGAPAVARANAQLGITHTVPAPDGHWGLTTTSAGDQLKLLENLVVSVGPLDATSRDFALGLMRHVETDQTWGISAVADPDTPVALKDGWLNVDQDDGRWAVNSVGVMTAKGQQVLMAVLTQHQPSFESGIELIHSIAHAALPAVT